MRLEFAPSSRRHGISEDRIRQAILSCRSPLYPPAEADEERDLVLFLGSDSNGVPLEVVAIEVDDGSLLVIHAMRMRSKYLSAYARVMEG
jgi:hypothetical protein